MSIAFKRPAEVTFVICSSIREKALIVHEPVIMKTDSPDSARFDISARATHPPQLMEAEAAGRDSTGRENDKVTPEQVQAAVRRFWDTWMAKSSDHLVDAYAT